MTMAKSPSKPSGTPSQVAAQKAAEKTAVKSEESVKPPEKKYPVPYAVIHHPRYEEFRGATGKDIYAPALTMADAKRLLGWETEAEYIAKLKRVDANLDEDAAKKIFQRDKFLVDLESNAVALRNNTRNRPWGESISKAYMQDILKLHWEFNGEDVIIGEYGRILSGQHRLIGLIFAEQSRTLENEKAHWEDFWKDAVNIPIVIMYGIEESGKVTRTIDNVKSRTLSDVIYADTEMFGNLKSASERKSAARCLEYSVRLLWERTGSGDRKRDSWAPKRTHSESLDFVDRHKTLKDCVKHILEEEKTDGRISRFMYPGHAAALMYLMATTGNKPGDIEDYFAKRPLDQRELKFPNLKKAKMFWSDLARADASMAELITAKCPVRGNEEDAYSGAMFPIIINDKRVGANGTQDEQLGTIIRAWNAYVKDEPITYDVLKLKYDVKKDPVDGFNLFVLDESPTVADSIDQGKMRVQQAKAKEESDKEKQEKDELLNVLDDISDEEGDERAEEVQTENKGNELGKHKATWDKDKSDYAGHVLVYHSPLASSNNYLVLFNDAELWAGLTGRVASEHPHTGVVRVVVDAKDLDTDAIKVIAAGHNILVIGRKGEDGNRPIAPYSSPESIEEGVTETPKAEEKPAQSATPEKKKVVIRK